MDTELVRDVLRLQKEMNGTMQGQNAAMQRMVSFIAWAMPELIRLGAKPPIVGADGTLRPAP